MHVCICKFMWHRIDLSPRGMTIKFHLFVHSFINSWLSSVCCACMCMFVCLHRCRYVFAYVYVCVCVCVYVAAGRFCMCVRVCLCVWSRLHGTHTCVVFCGKKNLLIGKGNGGVHSFE